MNILFLPANIPPTLRNPGGYMDNNISLVRPPPFPFIWVTIPSNHYQFSPGMLALMNTNFQNGSLVAGSSHLCQVRIKLALTFGDKSRKISWNRKVVPLSPSPTLHKHIYGTLHPPFPHSEHSEYCGTPSVTIFIHIWCKKILLVLCLQIQ